MYLQEAKASGFGDWMKKVEGIKADALIFSFGPWLHVSWQSQESRFETSNDDLKWGIAFEPP